MIITRAIGIDLGTTNSAVAMLELDDQDVYLYTDAQGRSTMPSCVWKDPRKDEIVVGHRAYAHKGTFPEPISSIKRSMGTRITVPLGSELLTPSEISAYLLRELKRQIETELQSKASEALRFDVSHAIVTVPAYFGLPAIEATRDAGRLAGIEVTELLHEPTAAAIYYSWKHDLGDGIYLVYDLGGGTFDVSVLQRTAGEFLVLGISGDNFLGGDDFDRRLAEHLRTLLVADDYDIDLDVSADPEDQLRFNQLVTLAERVKKELSTREEFVLRDQGTIKDKSGVPVVLEFTITRSTFEGIIDDLLERTIVCCREALSRAYEKSCITLKDVDHILLVGGSTYVPAVMHKVKQALCQEQSNDEDASLSQSDPIRDEPENAVALGAALRAAASGLGISDDKKQVRVWFRGANITKRGQANISGYIEPLQDNLNLEGGCIRIKTDDNEELGEVPLKAGLQFVFPKLALQVESLNRFQFEVLDCGGAQIALLQRSILQATGSKEVVGSTLSTSVLSKPIVLEGTDGDRLVRQVLLAEGSSLPAITRFTFAVNDPSGNIRLPIYQESRVIKELQADVGEVKIGTPVDIEVSCDQQVNIQVRFSIGEKEYGGNIAPPPPDAVPTEYEIQQSTNRFYTILRSLDEDDRKRLQDTYDIVYRDLMEALKGADYPKVIQKAKDLEGLVREARIAEPLRPPLEKVESNYAACNKLLVNAGEAKSGVNISLLRENIDKAISTARQAYKNRNRETYDDCVQIIYTSLQFLINLNRARDIKADTVDSAMQALMLLDRGRQMARFLLVQCLIHKRDDLLATLKNRVEELDTQKKHIVDDPVRVTNRCQVIITEMKRIHQEIMPKSNLDKDLGGLLKVNPLAHDTDFMSTSGL